MSNMEYLELLSKAGQQSSRLHPIQLHKPAGAKGSIHAPITAGIARLPGKTILGTTQSVAEEKDIRGNTVHPISVPGKVVQVKKKPTLQQVQETPPASEKTGEESPAQETGQQ